MSNRREFISKAATICLVGVTAGKLTSLHADGHMVSESDPNAKALGYVADASMLRAISSRPVLIVLIAHCSRVAHRKLEIARYLVVKR